MIVESIFSCSNLLLTCGSSIYILINHSDTQYSKFFPHLTYACVGIALIGVRSLFALVYKLFFKEYTFDPVIMELEEQRNKERCNIFDEMFGTLSLAGLIFSLYCRYGYCGLGGCVVTSLIVLDTIQVHKMMKMEQQEDDESEVYDTLTESEIINGTRLTIFNWVILPGYFAYAVGSNYALAANYPLLLTNWALCPEGFYQGWTIRRTINDYMMATYIMCMTEALRQADTP